MPILRSLLVSVGMMGAVGSCSGSLQTPRSDAGRDATTSIDRPKNPPVDGNADGKGGLDARDGGTICPPLEVTGTWADVLAHPDCRPGGNEYRYDCGPYHVRRVVFVDQGETYYYDIASGVLVAIYNRDVRAVLVCRGGPPDGITVDCANATGPDICNLNGGLPMDGGAIDGGGICSPLNVATQCPGGVPAECEATWADVLANPYCEASIASEFRANCGPYNLRVIELADEADFYYYDATSGTLLAIFRTGADGQPRCVGGPPGGIPVKGCPTTAVCTADGRVLTDGGTHG